jgi:hypothetical protein
VNSNTAGLPSVAEAGDRCHSWSRIIIIDCSSSRSVPEAIVKVWFCNSIAVVFTYRSRSSTRRYLLFAKW